MRKHKDVGLLLETSALSLAIFLMDVLGRHKGFVGYSFNPYWITIFLASAWWGLDAFLITSVEFIIVLTFSFYIQKMPVNPFLFSSSLLVAVVFGSLLGIVGESHKRKILKLEREKEEKEEKILDLKNTVGKMKQTLENLRENLFLEGNGLSLVFQRLRELEISDVEEMFSRFVEIISEVFDVKSISIYRENNGYLRFFVGKGRRYLPNSLKLEDSLVIRNAFKNGIALISDVLLSNEIEEYEPWITVLIGEAENNDGVIVVEDVDKLSRQFAEHLRAVAQWFHANIENAKAIDSQFASQHKMPDGTWDEDFFDKMKKDYAEREKRFGIPYSILCFEVSNEVFKSVVREFRKDDFVTVLRRENGKVTLKVLLSVCDEKNKELIANRLKNKYKGKVSISVNC